MVSYPHAQFKLKKYTFYKVYFFNGAEYGSLLELFNKTLQPVFQPVLSSPRMIVLYSELENYVKFLGNNLSGYTLSIED